MSSDEQTAHAHLGTFAEGSRVIVAYGPVTITGTVSVPRHGGEERITGACIEIAGTVTISLPEGPVRREVSASVITVADLLNGAAVTAIPATCPECKGTETDAEQSGQRTIRLTCRECGSAGVYPVTP